MKLFTKLKLIWQTLEKQAAAMDVDPLEAFVRYRFDDLQAQIDELKKKSHEPGNGQ